MRATTIATIVLSLAAACGCASSDLVSKTANDAGYDDATLIESTSVITYGTGCEPSDNVAHMMRAERDGRYVHFTVCCGPDRANRCETVVPVN